MHNVFKFVILKAQLIIQPKLVAVNEEVNSLCCS